MRAKLWDLAEQLVRNFTPELKVEQKLLRYLLLRRAIEASADYIYQHMKSAQFFDFREDVYRYVFENRLLNGLILELGVHNGHSINYLAKLTDEKVHGFDSFEGLPDEGTIPNFKAAGTKWYRGKMSEGGEAPEVRENVVLHKGWFDQTLPAFFNKCSDVISVIHIDCDIYSSTVTSLECSREHLGVGSFLIFDEYLNYFGWEGNEHLAWIEFVEKYGIEYSYVAVANSGAVAVKITKI